MRTRIRVFVAAVCAVLSLFPLAACSRSSPEEHSLTEIFSTVEQTGTDYRFSYLPWGTPESDVMERLGFDAGDCLETSDTSGSGSLTELLPREGEAFSGVRYHCAWYGEGLLGGLGVYLYFDTAEAATAYYEQLTSSWEEAFPQAIAFGTQSEANDTCQLTFQPEGKPSGYLPSSLGAVNQLENSSAVLIPSVGENDSGQYIVQIHGTADPDSIRAEEETAAAP